MPKWTELAYELPSGEFESIVVDAVVRQNHDATATVTDHPVEDGSEIADHVRAGLDRLTIEGVITNTPIVVPASSIGSPNIGFDGAEGVVEPVELQVPSVGIRPNLSGVVRAGIDALFPPPAVMAEVLRFSQDFDRVRAVDERIRDLMATGTSVLILTSLRDYPDMVIVSYTPTRDAASGDSLRFVLEARRILVVTTETVAAPPEVRPRGRRGSQRAGEAGEGSGELGVSMLRQITDSLGVTSATSGG